MGNGNQADSYDLSGTCLVASNTNGSDPANFLYQICNNPKYGFVEYQAPTHSNPYLPLRQAHETDANTKQGVNSRWISYKLATTR